MSSVFKVMKPDCVLGCSGKSVAKRSIIPLNSALVRLHLTVGKLWFWCTPVPDPEVNKREQVQQRINGTFRRLEHVVYQERLRVLCLFSPEKVS